MVRLLPSSLALICATTVANGAGTSVSASKGDERLHTSVSSPESPHVLPLLSQVRHVANNGFEPVGVALSTRTTSDASRTPISAPYAVVTSPSIGTTAPVPPSTTMPTVVLGKFDWDLERVGSVTAIFTDKTARDEIIMSYSISHRTATVNILDIACKNLVPSSIVRASHSATIASPTHSLLSVVLDINQETVETSSIWKDGATTGEGLIELCVRVDLVLDDSTQTSVNFHEQKLYLTIGLSQGFSVSQIDLERDAADVTNEEAQVDFGITSCQCNADRKCASEILLQGDDLFICVFAPSDSGVEISAIEELDFMQGSLTIPAVQNSTSDALTAVFVLGKSAVIQTQLRSELFDAVNPANLTASGKVSVRFGNATRRNLRSGVGRSLHRYHFGDVRIMQQQLPDKQAGFLVNMKLASSERTDDRRDGAKTGDIVGGVVGGLAGIAFVVVVLLVLLRRRKSDKELDESPIDA